MADKNLYQYLGEDLQLEQFQKLAETIQKALGTSPHAQEIGSQLTKLRHKQEIWPAKVLSTLANYALPICTQQNISTMNQDQTSRTEEINTLRKKTQDGLIAEIARYTKLLGF